MRLLVEVARVAYHLVWLGWLLMRELWHWGGVILSWLGRKGRPKPGIKIELDYPAENRASNSTYAQNLR